MINPKKKRFFHPPSGVIMPFSYHLKWFGTKVLFSWKGRHIRHFFGHISGTGSRRHNPFTFVQCPYSTFRMSLRLSKSVLPSPRKRCEFNGSRPKNPIPGYISGTGSHYHDPFTPYLVGPKVTFLVVSPEPEVATIFRLHLFNAPIVPFE